MSVKPYFLAQCGDTKVVAYRTDEGGFFDTRTVVGDQPQVERVRVTAHEVAVEIATTVGGDVTEIERMVRMWRLDFEYELADRRHRQARMDADCAYRGQFAR